MKCSEGLVTLVEGARLSMLRGELVNENRKEEPVCLECGEGLVTVMAGARPSVLRGELVNENRREAPVCLKRSKGLISVKSRSSSVCVERRPPQ